jgi:hypothetical protein
VRAYDALVQLAGRAAITASTFAWSVEVRLGEPTLGSISEAMQPTGVAVTVYPAVTAFAVLAGEE